MNDPSEMTLPSFGQTPKAIESNLLWTAARRRLWGKAPQPHPPVEIKVRGAVKVVGVARQEYGWPKYPPVVFYDHCEGSMRPPVTWKTIAAEVCSKHSVTMAELMSPRRKQNIVHARHEAFYRCSLETSLSLAQIGRRLGGFDHTTVISGMKRHAGRLEVATNG